MQYKLPLKSPAYVSVHNSHQPYNIPLCCVEGNQQANHHASLDGGWDERVVSRIGMSLVVP
jgi:hypothetical protein